MKAIVNVVDRELLLSADCPEDQHALKRLVADVSLIGFGRAVASEDILYVRIPLVVKYPNERVTETIPA